MNIVEQFESEFNEFIDVTYKTYWNEDVLPRQNFSSTLHKTLKKSLGNKKRTFDLTKEDLEQHLSLLWLIYEEQYNHKDKKPDATLKTYIIRRSIWGLRDWLSYEINIVTEEYNPRLDEEIEKEFKLDVLFLLEGSECFLLKELSPYERYIIFLKFKEDKSILQMSYILQKDRRVVKKQFDSIISKIKERHFNELQNTKNSRRYCYQ